MHIAGVPIGAGHPCFVVAEAGVNHNGNADVAHRLVDVAAEAGASAVKFQTFRVDRLVSTRAEKAQYQIDATGDRNSQHDMLSELLLSESVHRELRDHCRERGLIFLSTPFDEESADFLESLELPAYKIASGDVTNHPLLAHVSGKGKPVILSTGMATMEEVAAAASVVKSITPSLALLQCVSNYPADPRTVNLRVMQSYTDKFHVPTGYSDHTQGICVAVAAATLGAAIIEKHFTLDRRSDGPDHKSSLEPHELTEMIASIRIVESALGDGAKVPLSSELIMREFGRRSLHWSRNLAAGHRTVMSDFIALRPGTGLPPYAIGSVAGRRITCEVHAGEMVNLEMFADRETTR